MSARVVCATCHHGRNLHRFDSDRKKRPCTISEGTPLTACDCKDFTEAAA